MHSTASNHRLNSNSPIFLYKTKILETIKMKQVVIIVGQTGCGKSTQIPKYLLESGFARNGIIACLHPRCIAAMTLADRVAYETNTAIGSLVGYRVRFYSQYSKYTKLVYMTTGYMLRILQEESDIGRFSVVIIDEAHERSIQNDIMMARMKLIMKTNKYVKLVIMSATLNEIEMNNYYPNSVTVKIKETEDLVEVIYRPVKDKSYILAIKDIVKEILDSTESGDILVFLPSEEKVRKCKRILKEFKKPIVLPFYSGMDNQDKMKVFEKLCQRRKVIVATNIAETSLTIEGVDFVIDSGYVKRVKYNHETRVENWVTEQISIAEANQRKGRTGRTGIGKCYRLYEDPFVKKTLRISGNNFIEVLKASRPQDPVPEILNVNLGSMILMLKSVGINDINEFPFVVKPVSKNITDCIAHLRDLSLLNKDESINNLGRQVAYLPLEYTIGKVVAISSLFSCHREVLIIAALSSVMNIFKNPSGQESKLKHQRFNSVHGDLFKLLNVYEEALNNQFSKVWCKENFINHSCLKYALNVIMQLHSLVPFTENRGAELSRNKENLIKKAFLSGFFPNMVYKVEESYKTCYGKAVSLHLETCADRSKVVMGTLLLTSATSEDYVLRHCISLNSDMLKAFAPQKYKVKITVWKEILKQIMNESDT